MIQPFAEHLDREHGGKVASEFPDANTANRTEELGALLDRVRHHVTHSVSEVMSLPSLRGDYRAIESYCGVESAQVSCPISILVGDSDPRVFLDHALTWRTHTTAGFDWQIFSGGHFYLGRQRSRVRELICDRLRPPTDSGVEDGE